MITQEHSTTRMEEEELEPEQEEDLRRQIREQRDRDAAEKNRERQLREGQPPAEPARA